MEHFNNGDPTGHGKMRTGVLRDLNDGFDELADGSTVVWDCDNRKLPQAVVTSTQSFTINMTNVLDGAQGILKIITATASAITLTFDSDFTNKSEGTFGQTTITNFTLPASDDKEYILSFVVHGSAIHWFFGSNVVIDWSTGINPTGWSSFTTKWSFYIDCGTYIILTWCIEGTGTGTTASFTLPIAPGTLYTGSGNIVWVTQTVNNTTIASGLTSLTGGSTSAGLLPALTGGNWTNATSRISRGTITYFK